MDQLKINEILESDAAKRFSEFFNRLTPEQKGLLMGAVLARGMRLIRAGLAAAGALPVDNKTAFKALVKSKRPYYRPGRF